MEAGHSVHRAAIGTSFDGQIGEQGWKQHAPKLFDAVFVELRRILQRRTLDGIELLDERTQLCVAGRLDVEPAAKPRNR